MTVAHDATRSSPNTPTPSAWSPPRGSPSTSGDPGLVVVESDEDVLLYDTGHIPGAVKVDWHTELNDPVTRDYVDGARFAEICGERGIGRDTTVVFYGDQQQLVGHLRPVGVLPVRPRRRADPRRRPGQVDGRGPRDHHRGAQAGSRRVPGRRARRHHDPGVPRGRTRPPRPAAGRRPLARRVLRRAAAHARLPAGGRGARRAHPRRGQRAVGAGRRRGRHVQAARRPRGHLPHRAGPLARRRRHRLLPHRRALQPHLVRAHPPARLRPRPQLRRQLDRVGQHRARADRPGQAERDG